MSRGALRVVGVLLLASALTAGPTPAALAASTVQNSGFESGGAAAVPSGWSKAGAVNASYSEAGGRTGSLRLSHWAAAAYRTETFQRLTGLANGAYTATAWVRSSGGQKAAYLALRDCGGAEARTALPVIAAGWVRVAVSTQVTGGGCTVAVVSDANAGNWANVDDVAFGPGSVGALQIRGADVSSLPKSEAKGGIYRTSGGSRGDALQILRSAGVNYLRLKVWVNPADGYNNKARVLAMAKRVKAQNAKLLVDLHYSDAWADPGQQRKPAAWASHSFTQLQADVYAHTYDVLSALKAQGTPAGLVQIGNELNSGMLLPDGSSGNFANLAKLLKSRDQRREGRVELDQGHAAHRRRRRQQRHPVVVRPGGGPRRSVRRDRPVLLRLLARSAGRVADQPRRRGGALRKAGRAGRDGVRVHAPEQGRLENIIDQPSELVAGYPATPAGQLANLTDVMNVVKAVPGGRGLGSSTGSPPGPRCPATAGIPPIPTPATAGRTRRSSTTPTGRCPRSAPSPRKGDQRAGKRPPPGLRGV